MLPTPQTIEFDDKTLCIQWKDGPLSQYHLSHLRRISPCAQSQMNPPDEDSLEDVRIESWSPVGRYAIRIYWSDGHHTGIYTFDRLWALVEKTQQAAFSSSPALERKES